MDTSIFIARVIGIFGTISAIAFIFNYRKMVAVEAGLSKNREFTLISGFVILLLGSLIVASHSVGVWDFRLLITLIGWMLIVKGTMRIFYPDLIKKLIEKKEKNSWLILGEIVFLLMCLYLIYIGYLY